METITVITIAIAIAALGIAFYFFSRARTLATAVDDARARIGGSPPKWSWRRADALDDALQRLERSTSQAQRERSQLAGAVQAATEAIVITDDHGVVLLANHAASELLGARQGEEVAEPKLGEAIEEAVLSRTTVSAEIELLTPVRRILEIGVVPLDLGVESVGAVAYMSDVTELRRAEAVRRDFVANVGRELNAPLSALSVLAESIASELEAPGTKRMARRLATEADRLSGLIESILDLSQAEALASSDQPIAASALIAAVVETTQPAAADGGVELIVADPPGEARVSGDIRQLRTMLINLVENAINHSNPATGDAAPRVWLRTSTRAGSVVFDVQDEGIGIPEDHVDRVFERFYRVDRGHKSRATGGAGLGLSIARHVARNHGGDVTVMSKSGEGSIFTATLPLWTESG